jgi:hypothetical protein
MGSTGNEGVDQLNLNLFRKCGILPPLLLLMLGLLLTTGCIKSGLQGSHGETAPLQGMTSSPALEMDFISGVSSGLLWAEGNVVLWGDEILPYLILNATFYHDGRPEKSIRYMMIEVEPQKELPFKICKNAQMPPGNYTCSLEARGPDGQLGTETRTCEIARDSFAAQETTAGEAYGQMQQSHRDVSPAEEYPFVFLQEPLQEEEKPANGLDVEKAAGSSEVVPSDNIDMAMASEPAEARDEGAEKMEGAAGEMTDLLGSSSSKKYHLPGCRYVAKIRPENLVHFASETEAREQGYQPCRICLP